MGCFPVSSRQMLMAHIVAITEKNNVIESVFSPEFASYMINKMFRHGLLILENRLAVGALCISPIAFFTVKDP